MPFARQALSGTYIKRKRMAICPVSTAVNSKLWSSFRKTVSPPAKKWLKSMVIPLNALRDHLMSFRNRLLDRVKCQTYTHHLTIPSHNDLKQFPFSFKSSGASSKPSS
jgi:hypothetical protein